jgi:hypothetical protein
MEVEGDSTAFWRRAAMPQENTRAIVQRYLAELKGEAPADPSIQALLDQVVFRGSIRRPIHVGQVKVRCSALASSSAARRARGLSGSTTSTSVQSRPAAFNSADRM